MPLFMFRQQKKKYVFYHLQDTKMHPCQKIPINTLQEILHVLYMHKQKLRNSYTLHFEGFIVVYSHTQTIAHTKPLLFSQPDA